MQFNNGTYQVPGSCAQGPNIPAVAFYQAQPQPTCPDPGTVRLPTRTQGTVFQNPERSCRLELGDIPGNTTQRTLLVLGGTGECYTDAELREIFGAEETDIIFEPTANCRIFAHQVVTGALTFSIDGTTEAIINDQFGNNAQQFLSYVTTANDDCAFRVTRDNRCNPCDNGEVIQSFGSVNCAPIVAGPQALFGYFIEAGARLDDVVLCVCEYSVESLVSCVAPPVCPPHAPAPPVATYREYVAPANGQFPVNGMNNGQFVTNGNGLPVNGVTAFTNGNGR